MRYEKELMDIENKIKELEKFAEEKEVDLSKEIEKQKKLYAAKSKEAYSKLNDWDKVSIAGCLAIETLSKSLSFE